uniref:Evi/Wls n=1 Tax=Schmidtea mediterranea TaxID=79327 RepID=C3U5A9_SCHMD|nr:Evi/Wls [Schmidtea mediterranea]
MPGVVLETLSWKKLGIFIGIIFTCQFICFLIGGFIAPHPNGHTDVLTEKCIDRNPLSNPNKWFYNRLDGDEVTCKEKLPDEIQDDFINPFNLSAIQIVFAAQFPLPRNGVSLNMSRWFQQLIGILNLDIKYEFMLTLDVRLGRRNKGDKEWTEIARSMEHRPLRCVLDEQATIKLNKGEIIDGYYYDCELLPLFSLGSCFYDEYLVNIRIPYDRKHKINTELGKLQDLWVTEIHQNGGFTMVVWFALKTTMFPLTLTALVFFWYRISLLDRNPNLLEQTIISLGVMMSILNFPIEWLSLYVLFRYNLSFWLVLSDIRQGGFYAMLLCFWVIFTGEHIIEDNVASQKSAKERLYFYWPQLIPVGAASCFLFIFELAERGVQLNNPFYSVWSNKTTAYIAIAFVAISVTCAPLYFIFLFYKIVRAIKQMLSKRSILSSLPEVRRKFYSGVIFRFTLFIIYTLLCATLTVIFFIVSQIDESQWKWGQKKLEYTSAFITGVYGMWNFYVISILCLYAPSHKYRNRNIISDTDDLLSNTKEASESVVVQYYANDISNDGIIEGVTFKNKL